MSILHAAAARGDLETVKRLLKAGDDPNRTLKYNGATPLMSAAGDRRAGADMLALLIERGANIERGAYIERGADIERTTTDNGQTALHFAAQSGSLDKVTLLLESGLKVGMDADRRDHHGYSPIILAGYARSTEKQAVIKALLAHGANPYRPTAYNETTVSACSSEFDTLRLFERAKVMDVLRWTPLMAAAAWGTVEDMRGLIGEAQNYALRDKVCRTVWHIAIESGDIHKTELLYGLKGMPMGEDVGLYPNVFYAIAHNHHEMLAWLIEVGADADAQTDLYTPVEYAAVHGAVDCVQSLIKRNATNPAQLNDALTRATTPETLGVLLDAGAMIDHVNDEGYSALKSAAEDRDAARLRFLLERGANPDAYFIGDTPLIKAVSNDDFECVRLLLDAGANVNLQTNPDLWFALQYVRSEEMLRVLLDAGAVTTLSDAGGATAQRDLAGWDERLVWMLDKR